MSYAKRMSWTEKMELSTNDMGFTYVAVGYPLSSAARSVTFTNNTDVEIYFTTDPTKDMLKLASHSYETWDITTNKSLDEEPILIHVGTQFYARFYKFNPPSPNLWVAVHCLLPEYGCGGS